MSNMQLDTLRRIVQEINASVSLHDSLDPVPFSGNSIMAPEKGKRHTLPHPSVANSFKKAASHTP